LVGYLNFRPFRNMGSSMWENLNIGGSASYGDQAFPGETLPLRTSLQSSENDEAAQSASAVFLEFEDDVVALGGRDQGALHLAWYYEQLSFESEVQVGQFDYYRGDKSTEVPVTGYQLALSYFITGEEVTGRTLVIPDHPFNPASGSTGPGAIEPYVRYSYLELGEQVFEDELANEHDWTRRISMVDLGWNWYPNRYVKFYFDWQISMYGSPVLINEEKDHRVKTNQLFWLRAQVFF
jgi:phosphate-selective porin OprO/OprP